MSQKLLPVITILISSLIVVGIVFAWQGPTQAPPGGNVSVPLNGPWVNVKNYGAKGDGATDDTIAIQNAINSLINGGTVVIPTGTYIVDQVKLTSNIHLIGQGWQSVLKLKNGAGSEIIKLKDEAGTSSFSVSNLKLDGNRFNQAGGVGANIMIVNGRNFWIENVYSTNSYNDSIWVNKSSDFIIKNNFVIDNGVDGISLHESKRATVIGNNCRKSGQRESGSNILVLDTDPSGPTPSDSVIVANNQTSEAAGNLGFGIVYQYSDNAIIIGNTSFNNAQYGISVRGHNAYNRHFGATIANNIVRSNQSGGIVVMYMDNAIIQGNNSSANYGDGIYILSSNRWIIDGNNSNSNAGNAAGSFGRGISVTGIGSLDSAGGTVKGNNVWSNGAAGILLSGNAASAIQYSSVEGNNVVNNGYSTAGGDDGIRIENVTDITVTGNVLTDTQGDKTQNYGIRSTGKADYIVMTGNALRGNGISATSLVGANNITANNLGN